MNLQSFTFLLSLLPIVNSNENLICNKVHDAFNVCQRNGVLVFVNETINDAGLLIADPNLSEISSNAFQDLSIAELKLDFKGNPIKLQSSSFEGLPHVTTLVIYSAIFSPQSNLLTALPSLTSLSITFCKIGELKSGTFSGLSNLINLYFNYNNITTITLNTFDSSLSKVLNLWLNNNQLTDIEPNALRFFSSLHRLQLNYNKLTMLKPGVFNGLTELNVVILNNNQLTSIERNVFIHMKHLDRIDLSYNKIKNIEGDAFNGLSLTFLNLRNNELTTISSGIFDGLQISTLNLAHNRISNIDFNAFANTKVASILFKNNNVTVDKTKWGLLNSSNVYLDDV